MPVDPVVPAAGPLPTSETVAETVAGRIRGMVIEGIFRPGAHLSEAALSAQFQISRNTLREVFRLLSKEGLLRHEPNRGVFVAVPDIASIVDLYRIRRLIQCAALAQARPRHPAVRQMCAAVERAEACLLAGDWLGVGSADLAFHQAVVDLADSPRLSAFFGQITVELRLAFGLLDDPEFFHEPFIDMNRQILTLLQGNDPSGAAAALERYLVQA